MDIIFKTFAFHGYCYICRMNNFVRGKSGSTRRNRSALRVCTYIRVEIIDCIILRFKRKIIIKYGLCEFYAIFFLFCLNSVAEVTLILHVF